MPPDRRRPPAPESLDPAHVLLMLEDADARRRVTNWLGADAVRQMLDFAGRAPPDDGSDRVVVLHGIMGGQLVDRRGLLDDVVWFDLPQLLYAGGLERLRLTVDGQADAMPRVQLEPTRPLRVVYDLLAWHLAGVGGLRVHPFAYDWRKSIDLAARKLHAHLEALSAGDPDARFSIVAHSMGGAVALRYAAQFGEHARRRLDRLVFLGVPVAGCFEPFQLWAGVHPTAARVDRIAPGRGETVRQVWATFPGMAELCADPRQFDAEALLDPATWPDLAPLAAWLPHGRRWRARARVPDWLPARTDVLLSTGFDTCVGLERLPDGVAQRHAAGDGAVPAAAAWLEGARHWLTEAHHPLLPVDGTVRAAVTALLRGGTCELPSLPDRGALPAGAHVHPPRDHFLAPDPTGLFGDGAPDLPGLVDRLDRGEACNGDAMWLFGCDTAPDPADGTRPIARPPRNTPPGPPRDRDRAPTG